MLSPFFGMPLYITEHAYEVEVEPRTWKERLFTWPWRPWVSTKARHVPVIYACDGFVIAHPEAIKDIAKEGDTRPYAQPNF